MDVLNLSIGGPDYLDLPFVEKVRFPLSAGCCSMTSFDCVKNLVGLLRL